MLEQAGHDITVVRDGFTLGRTLDDASNSDQLFDIAIIDTNMGGAAGSEAVETYRAAHPEDTTSRFVLLAADATDQAKRASAAGRADAILLKPISLGTLLETVHGLTKMPVLGVLERRPTQASAIEAEPPAADPDLDPEKLSELEDIAREASFVEKLLRDFCENSVRASADFALALELGNGEMARRIAHALAGNAVNVGCVRLGKRARRLATASIRDLLTLREREIRELEMDVQAAVGAIQSYLSKRAAAAS
jgi:CheY-like chemotaxis protein